MKDRIRSVLEYIIATLFIAAAVALVTYNPPTGLGPVAQLFGGKAASIIYLAVFAFNGLGLLYAKLAKKKKLHKNVLMSCYLTSIFVFVLELFFVGLEWSIIDFPIVFLASSWCWLQWKLKTEYIDTDYFYESVAELRDDLPPRS